MCSEFKVVYKPATLEKLFSFHNETGKSDFHLHAKLTAKVPTLVDEGGSLSLREFVFPQRPFPNARLSGLEEKESHPAHGPTPGSEELRRIYDRKTWSEGFTHRRCLVPMSSFLEPAYWGASAGSVMEFLPPEEGTLFFVPAIRIQAQVPRTSEAFSLLTHVASEQMLEYHHRLLVLLQPSDALTWIEGGAADPEEKFEFLLQKRWVPEFRVREERRMAPGWKSRIAKHEADLESEKAYRSELKRLRLSA